MCTPASERGVVIARGKRACSMNFNTDFSGCTCARSLPIARRPFARRRRHRRPRAVSIPVSVTGFGTVAISRE